MASTEPTNSPSPASDASLPDTPVSPTETLSLPTAIDASAPAPGNAAGNKRKPSRRANTAERRATHNAVERQRRETLNGRFLDLAALLPNLSQIRRPSKSAIVNSSIAHIHSSRRHRGMASRELRLLKLEADALRRELNEWRDRASLPRVEEPVRSDAFALVLSGEVEMLPVVPGMDDEEDCEDGDDYAPLPSATMVPSQTMMGDDEAYLAKAYAAAQVGQIPRAHLQVPRSAPLIASGVSPVAYENPALPPQLYDAHPQHISPQYQQQQLQQYALFEDKNAWSTQLLAAQQQMQQMQQQQQQAVVQQANGGYITPPGTAHGFAGAQYFARQQGHIYGSPVDDGDASSVSSGRTRSGSFGSGPYGASPPLHNARGAQTPPGAIPGGYPSSAFPLMI